MNTRREMERFGWVLLYDRYPARALHIMRQLRGDTLKGEDLRSRLKLELAKWDEAQAIRVIKRDLLYAEH